MKMKILLCSIPDGSLSDTLKPFDENFAGSRHVRPIGILRLIDWMETKGYKSEVYDINNIRPSSEQIIKTFKRIKPTVVGLSANLTHCYPSMKHIAKLLRQLFPDIWIIVGGHLTASANVLLHKTEVDMCVIGDGEIPWAKLLDYFKLNPVHDQLDYKYLNQIKGLAFLDENKKLKVTGNAEQLPASELKYTKYDTLREAFQGKDELVYDLFLPVKNHYLVKQTKFYDKNVNKVIGSIETAKGCVARCTFCQRYTKGYRPYEINHLEKHILELKEKYNVAGLQITDENFGSNKKQSYEIARIMKKCNVFWIVGAARCTSITYEDLKFYKEHNLISVRFGIESGSQKILDMMEKKFLKQNVYNAVANCKKAGILTYPDAIMAGMPGETEETIKESAKFMASLRYVVDQDWCMGPPAFWAMAIPGTSLYEYCQQIGLIGKTIDEEEEYLIRVSEQRANVLNYLNVTESNNKEVYYWGYLFEHAAKKEYLKLIFKNNKSIKSRIFLILEKCIKSEIKTLTQNYMGRYKWAHNLPSNKNTSEIKNKIEFYIWSIQYLAINIFLTACTLLLPKVLLYPIIRMYAKMRFNSLKAKYKSKKGKQKYNFFLEKPRNSANDLRITEKRIFQAHRTIDRSLRSFTMDNRKKMRPPVTEEEKGLAILHQGQ